MWSLESLATPEGLGGTRDYVDGLLSFLFDLPNLLARGKATLGQGIAMQEVLPETASQTPSQNLKL